MPNEAPKDITLNSSYSIASSIALALRKKATESGQSISWILRRLIILWLMGEVDLFSTTHEEVTNYTKNLSAQYEGE